MNEIDVAVETTLQDWSEFDKRCRRQARELAKPPWWHSIVNIVVWAVIAICYLWLFQEIHYPTAGLVSALFISGAVARFFAFRKIQAEFSPKAKGSFVGHHTYQFNPNEIIMEGQNYKSRLDWSAVLRIEQDEKHIFLYMDTAYALLLPKRCIQNQEYLYTRLVTMKKSSNKE